MWWKLVAAVSLQRMRVLACMLGCVLACVALGCETLAGYDEREPWKPGSDDAASSDGAASACLAPWTRCGDVCVDLRRDFDHCGACGARCPPSAVCTTRDTTHDTTHDVGGADDPGGAGAVEGTRCVCPGSQVVCGATCAELASDRANCGGCGKACGPGEACSGGVCVCEPAFASCGTPTSPVCRDTRHDALACGTCTTTCGAGEYCAGSTCACRAGLSRCNGACVDTSNDPRHCGGCGVACAGSCRDGTCKPTCSGGRTSCPVGTGSACVDTTRDPAHCGGCGKPCAANEYCIAGACRASTPALGCAACPCDLCAALVTDGRCCNPLPGQTTALCVAGPSCPG